MYVSSQWQMGHLDNFIVIIIKNDRADKIIFSKGGGGGDEC